jgi:hypothetical protein
MVAVHELAAEWLRLDKVGAVVMHRPYFHVLTDLLPLRRMTQQEGKYKG